MKDCEWQCTLYTGEDRVELRNSLLTGLKEKDQPADAIKKTMELYKNCSDDEYDYCSVCYEAALIHLFRNHPEVLSEAEADEADRILKSYIEE